MLAEIRELAGEWERKPRKSFRLDHDYASDPAASALFSLVVRSIGEKYVFVKRAPPPARSSSQAAELSVRFKANRNFADPGADRSDRGHPDFGHVEEAAKRAKLPSHGSVIESSVRAGCTEGAWTEPASPTWSAWTSPKTRLRVFRSRNHPPRRSGLTTRSRPERCAARRTKTGKPTAMPSCERNPRSSTASTPIPVCHALYRCGRYATVQDEHDDLFNVTLEKILACGAAEAMKRVGKHIAKSVNRDAMYPIVMSGRRVAPPRSSWDSEGGDDFNDSDECFGDDDDDGDGERGATGSRGKKWEEEEDEEDDDERKSSTRSTSRKSWMRPWVRLSRRV